MANIKFIYGNKQIEKNYKDENILIINILLEYSSIINKDIKELYFIYNGKNLSFKNNEKIINLKNKNITINVLNLNNKKEKKELNQIICPECKELAIINFNEDKISINKCINNHNIIDISINELMNNQYINELKCDICNNDKYLYNDKFYICSCKQKICPLCVISHDKRHFMIEYNNRYNKCIKHNDIFISYCNNCNMNLCEKCEEEHNNNKHKRILYKEKKPNDKKLNEIKNEIKEIEKKIKQYKFEIQKLNNLYN